MNSIRTLSWFALVCVVVLASAARAEGQASTAEDDMPKPLEAYGKPGQPTLEQEGLAPSGHISTGTYVAAGIVGTTLGFGVGHAIAGIYDHNGIIFTAGELLGAGLFLYGAAATTTNVSCGSSSCTVTETTPLATVGGPVIFGALKIWEIIDIWTAPAAHNAAVEEREKAKQKKTSLRLQPWVAPNGSAGVMLGMGF
ncbi:MAG TPA: hypothetical protein VL588_07570 [Bdellovibrionota bacterium]|nr:hypothetical protein [Bdellovibrionota bacterium]